MSGARLTDQQRSAAHRGRGDACVLAGAGSGKTTVLTERFATLVRDEGVPARRIAALTFTEKAAGEMRERIARTFASSADPRLLAALPDVEFAPITTIHAFGARLLREHAVEAGVDPAFTLFDETEARLCLEDAWIDVERRLRRTHDPALLVLRRLGGEEGWRDLLGLLDRVRGQGLDPRGISWRREGADAATLLVDARRHLEDLDAQVAAAAKVKDAERAKYVEARALLPDLSGVAVGPDLLRLLDPLARATASRLLPAPRGADATLLRDALHVAVKAVVAALLDEVGQRELEAPLRHLLSETGAAYAERKRALGALDFTDLEVETIGLLRSLADRGRFLEGGPLRLLVDEFQDTNPLQAELLSLLRRPPGGAPVDLFAVGDPKQSIFHFRRADVGVMRAEWTRVGAEGQTELSESFRSRPELVAFHGALFHRLFADGAAGVAPQALVAKATFHASEPLLPEILTIDAGRAKVVDRREAEARAVARRIRAWVEEGALRTKVEKGGDGRPARPRSLRYDDVALLLRARTHVKTYEHALLEAGIPFHVGRGKGFYDTEEIADLVHLLRVVHDPLDGFAVAAWLTSPAVGGTDEDLLAAFGGDARPGAAGAGAFARLAALPRTARACARVVGLRRVAAAGSLEDLLREALAASDAIPVALLQDGGARRARNLEKALAIARRLDADGGHGLSDFLRRLNDLKDREIDEPEAAAGPADEGVAVLTVHASKGLEWPCVVLADTGSGTRRGGARAFQLDVQGRFGWQVIDPLEGTPGRGAGLKAIDDEEKHAEKEESLRLLYVALTRAEERLLVTSSVYGANGDGEPMRLGGWAKAIRSTMTVPFLPGTREAAIDGAPCRVTVEVAGPADDAQGTTGAPPNDRRSAFRRHGAAVLDGAGLAPTAEELAAAHQRLAAVREPLETLGRTPFVVTISDLLRFAASPSRFHRERIVGVGDAASGAPPISREIDDPASSDAPEEDDARTRAGLAAERWDEGREVLHGVDRAALGRAVHLAIERVVPGAPDLPALVREAVADEHPYGASPAVQAAALAMVRRFLDAPVGLRFVEALAAGRDVRREVAFHARIRFPAKATVAGFDALLVKGSIDLWMPEADGIVRILDHKTNAPGARFRDAPSLGAHYATQLRLYALAAERVLGRDVAGASLLLLDPAWGAMGVPVELEVDVGGDALADTRELCRAYATAALQDRWPARWEDLLA